MVAALCDPHGSGAAAILAEVAGAAKSLGLELVTVNASDPAQFEAAFAQAEHARRARCWSPRSSFSQ